VSDKFKPQIKLLKGRFKISHSTVVVAEFDSPFGKGYVGHFTTEHMRSNQFFPDKHCCSHWVCYEDGMVSPTISKEAMEVLRQLPDSPEDYGPLQDFYAK